MTATTSYLDASPKVRANIDRAAGLLGEYAGLTGSDVLEPVGGKSTSSDALADLLADLMQWAQAIPGVSFNRELDRARRNARGELAGDPYA